MPNESHKGRLRKTATTTETHCVQQHFLRQSWARPFVKRNEFQHTDIDRTRALWRAPSVTRTFCKRCGSTLQWLSQTPHPESLGMAIGALNASLLRLRQRYSYAGSKASWYQIADSLPQAESCV